MQISESVLPSYGQIYYQFFINSPAGGDIWLLLKIIRFNSIFILTVLLKSVAQNEKLIAKNEEIRPRTPLLIVFQISLFTKKYIIF